MSRVRKISQPAASALEDAWLRRATETAIASVREVVRGGAIPASAPVGRLSDVEIGWLVSAAIFGWIQTRAEQATAEGLDTELAIRITGFDRGEPWDAGAISAILPELCEASEIDWSKPVSEWPKSAMLDFLLKALSLIRKAEIARDIGGGTITRDGNAARAAREANAAAGGPLMTPNELNDPIDVI